MPQEEKQLLNGKIMDYKEKYEEKLSKAIALHNLASETSHDDIRMILEELFDELKESEDERIRKTLIDFIEQYGDNYYGQIAKASAIAWLEKQNPKKHEKELENAYKCADEVQYRRGYEDAKCEFKKQCKQKTVSKTEPIVEGLTTEFQKQVSHLIASAMDKEHEYTRGYVEWVAQSLLGYAKNERTSIDEIKPKFKVGDWVVSPNGVHWHIDSINNNRYEVSSTNGACADWPLDTDLYRFWTIQDVKNGDVLVAGDEDGEGIAICGKDDTIGNNNLHCVYDDENGFIINVKIAKECLLHPATKEQCDLLFSKMKEAGYEWDAEKKELKKIEQKPVDKVEQEEDVELTDFESALFSAFSDAWQEYLSGKEVNVAKWTREHSAELLEIAREQKPAWNEEDERNLEGIINEIEANKNNAPDYDLATYDRFLSWLKSLKNRVQPKQEWSEEEKARIDKIIDVLDWAEEKGHIHHSDWEDYVCYVKSLKPQNTTVTDEELAQAKKDAYNDALDKIEYHSGEPTFDDGWSAAIWYLKKRNVQPQNTWKPSDEQMKQLGWVAEQNKDNMIGKELMTLHNDLKKLREE